MLNVNEFYEYFHADWMIDDENQVLMLSGRFTIFPTDTDLTIILTENFTDHAAWIKRVDPLKSCHFLTVSNQLGVKIFYDKKIDQTIEAINDCKNMLIDV